MWEIIVDHSPSRSEWLIEIHWPVAFVQLNCNLAGGRKISNSLGVVAQSVRISDDVLNHPNRSLHLLYSTHGVTV